MHVKIYFSCVITFFSSCILTVSLSSACSLSAKAQQYSYSSIIGAWCKRQLPSFDELVNTYEKECFASRSEDAKIPAHINSAVTGILRIQSVNMHCCMGLRRITDKDDTRGFEAMCDVIKKLNADVLCVQELTGGIMPGTTITFIEYMQKELGYPYVQFAPAWRYDSGLFGNAIFSRVPFKDVSANLYRESQDIFAAKQVNLDENCDHHELFTTEGRSWVRALFVVNSKPLVVYTTHLDVWDKTCRRREMEAQELAYLVQKDKEAGFTNIVVAADFNSVLTDGYPQNVLDAIIFGMTQGKVKEPLAAHIYEQLKAVGLHDSYALSSQVPPAQTVWIPIRVDSFMLNADFCMPHSTYVHSNVGTARCGQQVVASDHKSLILDINYR